MKARLPSLLLLAACVSASPVRAQEPLGVKIFGYVTDAEDNRPLKGVSVEAVGDQGNAPATTDSDGLFILQLAHTIKAGDAVRIRCERQGYRPIDKHVSASSEVPLHFSMFRISASQQENRSGGPQTKSGVKQPDNGTQPPGETHPAEISPANPSFKKQEEMAAALEGDLRGAREIFDNGIQRGHPMVQIGDSATIFKL